MIIQINGRSSIDHRVLEGGRHQPAAWPESRAHHLDGEAQQQPLYRRLRTKLILSCIINKNAKPTFVQALHSNQYNTFSLIQEHPTTLLKLA